MPSPLWSNDAFFFCLFICFWQCHKGTIVSSMCFCFCSSLSLCVPWAWYLLQILHWRQLVHLLIIMVLAMCPHWCFSQSSLLQLWGIRHFNVLVSYKSIQVTVNVTVSFCALRQLSAHQPAYKLYVTFNLLVHFLPAAGTLHCSVTPLSPVSLPFSQSGQDTQKLPLKVLNPKSVFLKRFIGLPWGLMAEEERMK